MSSGKVFEVDHRFPCTGDTERIGIGLRKTVYEIDTAVQIFDPCNAVCIEERQITCLIESDEFIKHLALLVVLGVFLSLFEPINDMFEGFAVESTYFIDTLFDFAFLVLDELGVETDPEGFW